MHSDEAENAADPVESVCPMYGNDAAAKRSAQE